MLNYLGTLSNVTKTKYIFLTLATLIIVSVLGMWKSWQMYNLTQRQFIRVISGELSTENSILKEVHDGPINNPLTKELQGALNHRLQEASEKKIIVVWIQKFDETGPITVEREQCGNCEVTFDRTKVEDSRTGAVVFHFHALNFSDMPKRDPNHLHIWWNMESTATLRNFRGLSLNSETDYMFNGTMSYRRDSDFYQSYEFSYPGKVSSIILNNKLTPQEILAKKTKLAVSVMSNCGYTDGGSVRRRLINDLFNLGFDVSLFGGCFNKEFAISWSPGLEISDKFREEAQKYKFYFAFENSYMCKDYITEKFFNHALRSLAVPVVWGTAKEDYEKVAPPGSFIYVEDFHSLQELADHLNYLDKNDTAYLEYFRWLTTDPKEMPQYGRAIGFCHICRALHGINVDDVFHSKYNPKHPIRPLFTNGVSKRTVPSLRDWLLDEEEETCLSRRVRLVLGMRQLRVNSLLRQMDRLRNNTSDT